MPNMLYRCTKCGATFENYDEASQCENKHQMPTVVEEYNLRSEDEQAIKMYRDIVTFNTGWAFPNAIVASVPVVDEHGLQIKDEHGVPVKEYAVYYYDYKLRGCSKPILDSLYAREVEWLKKWGEYIESPEVAQEDCPGEEVGITEEVDETC